MGKTSRRMKRVSRFTTKGHRMPQFTFTNKLMERALRKAFLDGVMQIYESSNNQPRIYSVSLEGTLTLLINKSEKYYINIQEIAERAKYGSDLDHTDTVIENDQETKHKYIKYSLASYSSSNDLPAMFHSPLDEGSDIEIGEEEVGALCTISSSYTIPTTRTPMINYTSKQQRLSIKSSVSTSTTDSVSTVVSPNITDIIIVDNDTSREVERLQGEWTNWTDSQDTGASITIITEPVHEENKTCSYDSGDHRKARREKRDREHVDENGQISKRVCSEYIDGNFQSLPINMSSSRNLSDRLQYHSNVVECPLCREPISDQPYLLLHLDRHRQDFVDQCSVCKEGGQPLDVLLFHLTNFHLTKSKPPHLHLATTSDSESHLRIDLSNMEEQREKRSSRSSLKKKNKTFDGKFQIEYVCDLCGDSFKTNKDLSIHHTASHGNEASEDFRCCECNVKFPNMVLFQDHMLDHHKEEEKFRCQTCDQEFTKADKLKEHIISDHTLSYNCSHCKIPFPDNKSLTEHEKIHDAAVVVCDLCDAPFTSTRAYNAHRRSHVDAKPHVCQICHSTFLKKGDMAKHMRTIHEPKKLFMCKVCGRTGTRSDNMRVHVRTHKKGYSREMVDSLLQRVDQ